MFNGKGLDTFKLKIIGYVGTVLLSLAWCGIIPDSLTWLKVVLGFLGAVSIPVYALLLSEGLRHTKSVTLYMVRILVLAILCAFPYYTIYHNPGSGFLFADYLSGPFTVFYCAGILLIYDKLPYKWLKTGSLFLFVVMSVFIGVEFAPVSVIIAYIVHVNRDEKASKFRNFNIILFSIAIGVIGALFLTFGGKKFYNIDLLTLATLSGCALSVPLLNRYSGTANNFENKAQLFLAKYGFYAAYLILIVGIALAKYFIVEGTA